MPDILMQPVLWLLALALLIQLGIYLLLFRRLGAHKPSDILPASLPPVTIIISARDERKNLRHYLPMILEQDYPEFEVIVVDDQSEDGTKELLEEMKLKYRRLRVVTIEEHVNDFAGKKLALTLGIKTASYEIILLTDADCRPASPYWIRHMASKYESRGTQIVLGYSPYEKGNSFLSMLVRFDTFYTALQYFSMALAGNPYMGVGRNLSYTCSLFFENKGFAPYLKVSSGDDDLFVNRLANGSNTAVQLHPDSFVFTRPKETWSQWIRQKKRHLTAGRLYRSGHKRMLSFIWLSSVIFYISLVLGFIFIQPVWIPLGVLGLFLIMQFTIFYLALKRLKDKELAFYAPLLNILWQFFFFPLLGVMSLFRRKKHKW